MVHPVQALATQTEIMTEGGNACYYRSLSSGQARDCSVTVLESRIGTEDRRKRQAICSWADRAGDIAEAASTVAGQ